MRPTRLELQGFASFREATVVDFQGADLFVLSGPTGAGKSSIIDAMTFALYGSVARYGTKLVEPVISQGRQDARVLLDFTVDGVAYRVARLVQRTAAGGATTKEARLELLSSEEGGDAQDLAMGAKHVTAEVESLLGLSFEHFCRTVVLPQGAFQDFLHATPGERQELLVQLLDLGIYKDIAKRARARADEAQAHVTALTPRLEELAGVSDEAITTVRARVTLLDELATTVEAAQPRLDEIRDRWSACKAVQTRARADLERLRSVKAPEGLADLADRLARADQVVATATTRLEAATTAREAAEDASSGAIASTELLALARAADAVAALEAAHEGAGRAHEQAEADAVAARKAALEAEAGVADAQQAVRQAEASHGVHALRDHLEAGAPCPLCEQVVTTLPAAAVPADLDQARSALAAAQHRLKGATTAAGRAEVAVARASEQVAAAAGKRADHLARLAERLGALGLPADSAADVLVPLAEAAAAAEAELAGLRATERQARSDVKAAKERRGALDTARADALATLRASQAGVADLGAPAASDDLAASWDALIAWTRDELPARQDAVVQADGALGDAEQAGVALRQELLDVCTAAGVTVPERASPAAAVATARAEATAQADLLEARRAEATQLGARVAGLKEQASVAITLGRVLHANNFQKWLLARGLTRLILGASAILGDLSGGAYSLALGEDNAFLVADHRNAGEQRHARSLSGGETFLASLALALSLAEHVTDLAAKGSARLESLFLDEGFGTLDADTLDVVASSIEELGATGRMVGLITHVPELAQRLPVRFEVTKGPGGSRVVRVET